MAIITHFNPFSVIEEAHKHGIDKVGKEDEFDVLIQYENEWIGGDGMTKTVVSPHICINKGDKKQGKRVGEKITKRSTKWRFFDWMILLKYKCI